MGPEMINLYNRKEIVNMFNTIKRSCKKLCAVMLIAMVMLSSSVSVCAESAQRYTKSDSAPIPYGGTMSTSITVGYELAQGSMSTTVVSDMYIEGYCEYVDYTGEYTRNMIASKEQDYSCAAYISKSDTWFTYAWLRYDAYNNDDGHIGYSMFIDYEEEESKANQ